MTVLLWILLFVCLLAFGLEVHFLRRKTTLAREAIRRIERVRQSGTVNRLIASKQVWLKKMGVGLLLKDQMSVGQWYLYKAVLAASFCFGTSTIVIGVCKASAGGVISVIAALLGWFFLDFYLKLKNDASNEDMLPDIMEMSRSVMYGKRGGQYIADALRDSLLVVENMRLKTALIGLKNNLDAGKSIDESLDEFELGFSNAEISSFCTVIKSLQSTGQVDEALQTLRTNIERAQVSVNKKKTMMLEKKTMLYVIMIAMDIVAMILYCIVMRLMEMQVGF